MENNTRPLALTSFIDVNGPNSNRAAFDAVDTVFDTKTNTILRNNHPLSRFAKGALYGRIVDQSESNYRQYLRVSERLTEAHTNYIQGNKSPDQLTLFLYVTDELQSIETGRRTDIHWGCFPIIDRLVRDGLDANPLLYTQSVKSRPVYRIKNLNLTENNDQYYVLVDRKRTVRQHFGGKVLTIVRKSFVLHNDADGSMPSDIQKYIRSQRDDARRVKDYDYDQHSELLWHYMEEHVTSGSSNEKPAWIMPVMTTYYAVRREFMKANQLTDFDDTPTEPIN
jgi:hypothetical protein